MKQLLPVLILFTISCGSGQISYDQGDTPVEVEPFEISKVKLLDGPFKHAMELNQKTLLDYEPDRFLSNFRKEAGLAVKAAHYEGWEGATISGHSLGHYLSGCAMMYASTSDTRFSERVDYIVEELAICQEADGEGFIGAFPDGKRILSEEVAKGDIRSQGFDLNGIWVPFYNEHKTLAGLIDAYHFCENEKALDIAVQLADYLGQIVIDLTHEQMQKVLHCEFGGIQEAFADLYGITGEERFISYARKFHHNEIIDPLIEGEDILPGKHGNTQIPKLVGYARLYELTQTPEDKAAAENFWNIVVDHHTYVTGGHGNHEYFGPPDQLKNRLSDGTTETCNVYNMLKLSRHLFLWESDPEVGDFYERALFNHILAHQHPETGRVIYNLSLEMGGRKQYQNPEWFTCCIGTAMETHSKYGSNIFYHTDDEFIVSQFIAAEVQWDEMGVSVRQETNFPVEQGGKLILSTSSPATFMIKIRHPYWAVKDVSVQVNGEHVSVAKEPPGYITIDREWNDGDVVTFSFPFDLRVETMPDDEDRLAIFHGPVLLSGDIGPDTMVMSYQPGFVPVIMSESRDPNDWLTPVSGQPNTFAMTGVGYPRDIEFRPFYQLHDRRYSVYFDVFTQQKWKDHQQAYEEAIVARRKLDAETHDYFQPGEMQPEREHNFTGEDVVVMDMRGRKGRMANRGGRFSFEMEVLPDQPMDIIMEYWGGYTGSKTFDIVIEGKIIATENVSGKADGQFINEVYPIPVELTQGKEKIDVSFQPHVGHRAGPVFGVRTIRRNMTDKSE